MASADKIYDHRHRRGRPCQRAASGARPDPGRLRDGAGAAVDGHAVRRRVRPRGRDRRPHHGGHDEQHHPRDRRDRGHDPRRQRVALAAAVHDGVRRVVDGIAAAHGCSVEVEIEAGYPVTINNDERRRRRARRRRRGRRCRQGRAQPQPVMGAEDWSYVLQQVPGAMMFLGGTHPDRDLAHRGAEPLQPRAVRRGGDGRRHRRLLAVALQHLGLSLRHRRVGRR